MRKTNAAKEAVERLTKEGLRRGKKRLSPADRAPEPIPDAATIDAVLAVARENLLRYGTVTPPKEELQKAVTRKCIHCGRLGYVDREVADMVTFGWKKRTHDGQREPQSWCNRCRSSKDSHPGRQR